MPLFVLNIGNTNTRSGIYSEGVFKDLRSFPTSEFNAAMVRQDMPVAVACVVPEKMKMVSSSDLFCLNAADGALRTGLDLSMIDRTTFGADRLANAIGLLESGMLPGVVIDAGTAVSIVAVDRVKVVRGGAIFPGRKMQRTALNRDTAQLPFVKFDDSGLRALGVNTAGAVRSGVDVGVIGALKEIIAGIELEMNQGKCYLTAVGGDSEFICARIPGLKRGSDDFTLKGISHAWELNR